MGGVEGASSYDKTWAGGPPINPFWVPNPYAHFAVEWGRGCPRLRLPLQPPHPLHVYTETISGIRLIGARPATAAEIRQ
jgi:hypothetical protein